tara:strand:+ start:335 stop:1642 length:1308 start_codon:yes stop_codon:yes gene_type:complete
MAGNHLNDQQIKALTGKKQKYSKPVGVSLTVCVAVQNENSSYTSKSFVGKARWYDPIKKKQIQIDVPLGVYLKDLSLKEARELWEEIRREAKATGRDPREINKERKSPKQTDFYEKQNMPTLGEVAEEWFKSKEKVHSEKNHKVEGRRVKKILESLNGDAPIDSFKDENGGRKKCLKLFDSYINRDRAEEGKRVLRIARQIFDYVEEEYGQFFQGSKNPARNSERTKIERISEPNPHLKWHQIPTLLKRIEENKSNSNEIVKSATKLTLLSAQRVGTIAGTKFEEFDFKEKIWTIPKERMKGTRIRKKIHYVPITPQIEALIKKLSRMVGHQEYVFFSPRGRTNHLNESMINEHLKRLGYKGILTGHGLRQTFNTNLIDQFNQAGNERVIDMCLAHTIKGISDSEFNYNQATYWKPRVKLMKLWNKELEKIGFKA